MDLEGLREIFEGPGVVFAWVMAWEVGRGNIRNCLGIDAYYLKVQVSRKFLKRLSPKSLTFRRLSSSGDTCGAIESA